MIVTLASLLTLISHKVVSESVCDKVEYLVKLYCKFSETVMVKQFRKSVNM